MPELKLTNGRLCCEIATPKGEVHDYALTALATPDPLAWSCLLERLDSGERYLIVCDRLGRWSCECRDWQFRFRQHRGRPADELCKHAAWCQQARPVLQALTQPAPALEIP